MDAGHRVLIMKCDRYDPERIKEIIREGMEELGVRPWGKILLKPNAVLAHPDLFPHAFTRKEFLDGALGAAAARAKNVREISVGERSAITIPTRFCFKNAGYPKVIKKHGARTYYFEERPQVPVEVKDPNALRRRMVLPKPVAECDFLINLPKFKAHPWTRLTLSLKNFIGIQDDAWRLMDHNTFLEHKIADLQSVIQPKFIAIDAISAGQKTMITPVPFHMGAIVMGTNSCAVDTVGCHMVHVDPSDLIHLKMASERGLGPMRLDEIEVSGDFPLDEVRRRTEGFEFLMERIDEYFGPDGAISCEAGEFPEKHSRDYCWGGCPGALQEAIHIIRELIPDAEKKMKKIRYVTGKTQGPLNIEKDETVIFAGDCASFKGEINGRKVEIKSRYEPGGKKMKSNDMLSKNIKTLAHCFKNRKSPYVRARGCPMSVADVVHYLSAFGKIRNVNFDLKLIIPLNIAYMKMRAAKALSRLGHWLGWG
ncbi:conserved hypothetical protein [Candidatus Desulfarcum epimagneticum]|uniref:DUF362 domain-containing protein n=1 Tax=uncultured Desulfobacteraceae bacterium TaxID=218296 RepID=A0A484HJI0_9BACT|nr:conserved hypothetical protein [uncultured Desulfobacteraceae bacterium]